MRPPAIQYVSPNFKRFPNKRKVTCVVIHATQSSKLSSPLEWLTIPESKVSAHYLIDLDGTIYQLVDENNVAWHAGESEWRGQKSVNAFSIGIELVNANDGIMEYPEPQIEACRHLTVAICRERGIKSEDVVGHFQVSPGRKTDPLGFPFDDFRGRLYLDGVA